jgi:hypothetical protein
MTGKTARNGLGSMLAHFTRVSSGADALDKLAMILRDGMIRGSKRMVLGGSLTACIFDAPLGELSNLLTRANRRRYQPFGIAVDRRYAFHMGARPVIYLPLAEARAMLPESEWWRVVRLDLRPPAPVDWTFEREWRARGDLILPPDGAVALVATWRDVAEVYDRFHGAPPCAGVLPLEDLFGSQS